MSRKQCPKCKEFVHQKAKICPHCRSKIGMHTGLKIFLFFIAFITLLSISSSYSTSLEERKALDKDNIASEALRKSEIASMSQADKDERTKIIKKHKDYLTKIEIQYLENESLSEVKEFTESRKGQTLEWFKLDPDDPEKIYSEAILKELRTPGTHICGITTENLFDGKLRTSLDVIQRAGNNIEIRLSAGVPFKRGKASFQFDKEEKFSVSYEGAASGMISFGSTDKIFKKMRSGKYKRLTITAKSEGARATSEPSKYLFRPGTKEFKYQLKGFDTNCKFD